MEAVLKDMASPDSQAKAAVAPVVITSGVDARSEVGALVVEFYEPGHLQEGTKGPLQQAGILPQQGIEQTPVLLCKPAYTVSSSEKILCSIQLCRVEASLRLQMGLNKSVCTRLCKLPNQH